MPDLLVFNASPRTRLAPHQTRLAPHPLAITETTQTGNVAVEIRRKNPVGVVSVIAAAYPAGNRTVFDERPDANRHRLARQSSNQW